MSRLVQRLLTLFLGALILLAGPAANGESLMEQTDVDKASHSVNEQGVAQLSIEGVGLVDHPAWIALYALAYAGLEDYDPKLGLKSDPQRFAANIGWLKKHLAEDQHGLWVWPYLFDSTYNDISIKAPWSSAFAQAVGIQALLADWKRTQDKSSLELAVKAAESLFVPLDKGGFLFTRGEDIWFEEIPSPAHNPSHILNGHMRVLLALGELHQATGDARYAQWLAKGSDTLLRWLPLYDAGYWLRYDLNPRKDELLFRLANPYGFANPELAIDRIVLRDPVSGQESVLDVGAANDAEGAVRIAGNDWGQIESVEGRTVRRLKPVVSEREVQGSEGQMAAPYSYFYLRLPGEWKNNLRSERLELSIDYFDEHPGNLSVQMRSIAATTETFKSLPDADLLVSGSGTWRTWKVPVQPRDLGYWVGELYASKHAQYLSELSRRDRGLEPWAQTALAYLRTVQSGHDFEVVTPKHIELPSQTPMLPVHTLDAEGVVTQWRAGKKTRYFADGSYDPASDPGTPVYSPFIIARQLLSPDSVGQGGYTSPDKTQVNSAAALNWFLSEKNMFHLADQAVTYRFDFANTYNDIVTERDWASAFSQAYILAALGFALDNNLGVKEKVTELLKKAAHGYASMVSEGGISSLSKSGQRYFEEVPNSTHVLNAHLISIPELAEADRRLNDSTIKALLASSIATLREKLSQFDTGYWMRYDLNPKKELLFQLDWINGDASPLIESIGLQAPQYAKQVKLAVGSKRAFEGASRITGLEWLPEQRVEGRQVRAFTNGYRVHQQAVSGGTRQNVYALLQLPERKFSDYFEVRPHRFVVRYKDVAAGTFVVRIQSIHEGGVLDFVPLRNAVITTTGDQQWKESVVEVRPQDMGWYKGADYQVYEVEQLKRIAQLTGDWFFEQYAERQAYFLAAKAQGHPVIAQPVYKAPLESVDISLLDASPTYEGFGFDNALDGDLNDDYTAGVEGDSSAYVTLKLSRPVDDALIKLNWESKDNYAGAVRVLVPLTNNGGWREVSRQRVSAGEQSSISIHGLQQATTLKLEFSDLQGQPRVLMRGINVFSLRSAGGSGRLSQTELSSILEKEISARLKSYSEGPLFNQMSVADAREGTEGNCSHTALWMAMKMHDLGIPFRVLAIESTFQDGQPLYHAMTEVKVDGKWQLTDPLNGWLYPIGLLEMRNNPTAPLNATFPGRKGHEVYKERFFFENINYIEAYEDLAYTGLFTPVRKYWRYDLLPRK
ncbi:hypothetical protein NJC38_08040 [Pseudomonas sp. 21LCFQ010]|uniref:D-glucuronyl C5-epimerase family protein n=1 Tax=Pseudomonas sp. 21LCFQ010 TaxID=2957506 RepID=UPI002096A6EE|nr:D-glucuronyl C5-epimerase family protein [Pseudomonas sp. 21LCFQ010]MCO8162107.1 hypothetical protein [Pseudomonas sp. 21LCFQ010]